MHEHETFPQTMGVVSAAVRTHREFIVRLVKPKRFSVGLDGFVEDNIFSMFSTASRLSVVYLSRISKWKFRYRQPLVERL
jgi:hypothetical protein